MITIKQLEREILRRNRKRRSGSNTPPGYLPDWSRPIELENRFDAVLPETCCIYQNKHTWEIGRYYYQQLRQIAVLVEGALEFTFPTE